MNSLEKFYFVKLEKINADLNLAIKAGDKVKVSTLRFLLANLHNAKIAKGADLTDEEVEREIARDVKRHKESIEAFEAGGREDLVSKERAQLLILERYLPKPLSEGDIENIVGEAIEAIGARSAADIGRVIKAVMSSVGSRADGAKVAEIAKRKLSS